MKKTIFLGIIMLGMLVSFTNSDFSIENLADYEKQFKADEIDVCSTSSTKTYESYKLITSKTSAQYKYIQAHMTVDEETGFLYNENGFIGAALGHNFLPIGSEYYFTLDSGIVLPIVMIDEKALVDAPNGCSHSSDSSVIEFVIDKDYAIDFFGSSSNGYVNNGNYNNDERFAGKIVKIEKVTAEKAENSVVYETELIDPAYDKQQLGTIDQELQFEGGLQLN